MKMLEACLNWKVLASLGVAGVAIYLVAPRLVATALPLVLLAACPLSMVARRPKSPMLASPVRNGSRGCGSSKQSSPTGSGS